MNDFPLSKAQTIWIVRGGIVCFSIEAVVYGDIAYLDGGETVHKEQWAPTRESAQRLAERQMGEFWRCQQRRSSHARR